MKWISVKDRLPEIKKDPTCYDRSDQVLIWFIEDEKDSFCAFSPIVGNYSKYGWGALGELPLGDVTHWMPLPDAPTVEGEKDFSIVDSNVLLVFKKSKRFHIGTSWLTFVKRYTLIKNEPHENGNLEYWISEERDKE